LLIGHDPPENDQKELRRGRHREALVRKLKTFSGELR